MTEIVKYPHPALTSPTIPFDFINPPVDPLALATEMIVKMNESRGIGLSANQLGYPYRVFVMRGEDVNFACFNPKIVNLSEDTNLLEEGCLSFPGVNVKIKRSNTVRIRFETSSGVQTRTFAGLTARVVQHEMDHLDGVLFFNRANKFHRDRAMKGFYDGKFRVNT